VHRPDRQRTGKAGRMGGRNIKIEVDGGINPLTAAECIAAGADILVAGTSVFDSRDYRKNIDALR